MLRHEDLHLAKASGVGNQVILYGAKTGGDGIGGVSILASETFEDTGPAKRPSVQVGDPFMEKLLIECTLELFAAGLVSGIQDLGGAGLSCATSELASAGDGGMHVELDTVPLRDSTLAPEEILMSESQERMMAVVAPADVDAFLEICAKWEVDATVIGEVTDTGRLQIDWHGERVVDVPPRSVAHDGPTYQRPFARPEAQDALQADRAEALPRPATGEELRETLLRLAGSPNLCDKSWITDQYDRYVRGNTVLAQPSDSGMVRVDEETGLGVAVATDCNGRFAALDPYAGAQLALAEAYRNVATSGATPLAISDCLNFGSPEDPGVMWQFAEACRGLKDACVELGIPVTGGNVSLYNQTGETAILPTPVVAVLGVIDDVSRRTPTGFVAADETVLLLGETREELSGSEWAHVVHKHLGGLPPSGRPGPREGARRAAAARRSAWSPARTTSPTVGSPRRWSSRCSRNGVGVRVSLEGDPFVALFSESAGRVLVTVPSDGRRAADRAGRAPRRTGHRRSAAPAGTRCRSTESSTSISRCCATPGRARFPTPLADELEVADGWVIPAAELTERFSRSSGPGGQGVNTTDSRVELSVDVTRPDAVPDRLRARVVDRLAARLVDGVLTVTASEHRAQLDNRRAARDRLADVLRRAAAPPPRRRRPTRPTRGSQERRLAEKKRRGQTKRGRQGRFD